MDRFDHLWNDLPLEERNRLLPHMIESQIRHLRMTRAIIVRGHKRTLAELDDWIGNLERGLAAIPSPARETGDDDG